MTKKMREIAPSKNWPIEKIIPYENNPRSHPPEQVRLLADLIGKYGPDQNIVVDEKGIILKGHGRLEAAVLAGLKTFPVTQRLGLSEADKRAIRISDNQVALLSGWNQELLRVELTELSHDGFDMNLLGFPDMQLVSFMANVPGSIDEAKKTPEPPVNPVSKPGDVWLLGKHRIICGDSTKAEDVTKVLAGAKPHLMVTDPPYGVEYDADWRNHALRMSGGAIGKVENDDRADWRAAWELFPGDVAYVWHADRRASEVQQSLEAAQFDIRCQIIWAKDRLVIGRGDYHWQHEPCWYAVRKGKTGHWAGDRKQTTVWQIDKPQKSETGHSTQKPIECMKRPIENNSQPGDFIYDPFLGSGTTLIAAEMVNRYCIGIELSPAYVDVCVKRWQDFTKKDAILDGDTRTFNEIAKAKKKGPQKVSEGPKQKAKKVRPPNKR